MLENQPLPPWSLTTLDGSPAPAPEAFLGKPLLILIFNVGCLGCLGRALPFSLKLLDAYPDLQVIAIHTHTPGPDYPPARIEAVKKANHLPYPVYLDQGHETYDRYRAEGTPHWVLLDAEGKVRRSIWGSMANAQQRLDYALAELFEDVK